MQQRQHFLSKESYKSAYQEHNALTIGTLAPLHRSPSQQLTLHLPIPEGSEVLHRFELLPSLTRLLSCILWRKLQQISHRLFLQLCICHSGWQQKDNPFPFLYQHSLIPALCGDTLVALEAISCK